VALTASELAIGPLLIRGTVMRKRNKMGDTWVTDIRHYLDDDGNLAEEIGRARRLAGHQCAIIEAVTARPRDQVDWETSVRCRRRPRRKRCEGNIVAGFDEADPSTIVWLCPFCADNGYIRGWQETQWDKRTFS